MVNGWHLRGKVFLSLLLIAEEFHGSLTLMSSQFSCSVTGLTDKFTSIGMSDWHLVILMTKYSLSQVEVLYNQCSHSVPNN